MKILLFILFFFICKLMFAQSETPNAAPYDTSISYTGSGAGSNIWRIRISRNPNYFTSDTASRVLILTMQGAGEVSTTSFVNNYGPHYWINTGWDGGVQLGNGKHYPIYITVVPAATNVKPYNTEPLILSLLSEFHPRSSHFGGLSMGFQCLGWALIDSTTVGTNHLMSKISSFVVLQGENPSTYGSAYTSTFPNDFATWATTYNGKMLAMDGTADAQINFGVTEAMNAATPGSAFLGYSTFGGGTHGGSGTGNDGTSIDFWNYFYDRRTVDLTNSNPVISYSFNSGTHPHTMGTYTGPSENVYQWMLRQGDTTLVGQSIQDTLPAAHLVFIGGEYVTGRIKNGVLSSMTDGSNLAGASGSVNKGGLTLCTTPAGVLFANGTNTLHGITAVSTKGYGYSFGGNDQGQLGLGNFTNPTTTPGMITVDSAGTDSVINLRFAKGFYGGNVGQGLYLVKKGVVSDTLFATGDTRFGMRGDGTLGDTVNRPVKVWVPGHHILQIAAERFAFALLDDGTVWSCGGATPGTPPNYAWLGYAGSGNQYLTWHQVAGFDDSIRQIAGGHLGAIAFSKTSKLWGWGLHSAYLGNGGDVSYSTPHDLTDSVTAYIPGGIDEISANSNAYYILSNLDSAYAFGDNSMAAIGNGIEKNMQTLSPNPYSYDPAAILGLMQYHPTLVNHKGDWAHHYSEPIFGFTSFWVDQRDSVYVNGRNKGGVLGNGVTECTGAFGAQTAAYPNSWDVVNSTRVTQDTIFHAIPVICPGCQNGAVTTSCGLCTNPSTTPHSVAGTNQQLTFGTTATQLNGTGSSSTGGSVLTYTWTQTAGTPAIIVVPSSPTPEIKGLSTGTSTFQLTITDNGTRSDVSTVNVTVGGGNSIPIPYGSKIIAH